MTMHGLCNIKISKTVFVRFDTLKFGLYDAVLEITNYYGLAIRRSVNNLEVMKRAVWANSVIWTRISKTVFVRLATLRFGVYDAILQITNCYGLAIRRHVNSLEVMKRAVWVNFVIWRRISRTVFVRLAALKFGVYDAILQISNYHGLAIRRNVNNLEVMKRGVWAVFFHKLLRNEKSQYGVYPNGVDSWCKFKIIASSGVAYEHKHSLPDAVMDAIKQVFRDHAGVDPLKKCFHGKTHNRNEVCYLDKDIQN
jgi:hypothetical protein